MLGVMNHLPDMFTSQVITSAQSTLTYLGLPGHGPHVPASEHVSSPTILLDEPGKLVTAASTASKYSGAR